MDREITVHGAHPDYHHHQPGLSRPASSLSPESLALAAGFAQQDAGYVVEEHGGGQQDGGAADGPSKAKKPRLPRIAEACVRCKSRKQRCIRDGPGSCKNCAGVNAECVIAPRVKRRSTKKQPPEPSTSTGESSTAPTPSAFVSAPSPSSLSSLLRTESAGYDPAAPARPLFPTASPMYSYPAGLYPSPPFPAHPLPAYGTLPPRGSYMPPPSAPAAHIPYAPPPPPTSLPQRSPTIGSPSLGLSAPVSSVRSDHLQNNPFPSAQQPSASQSPGSALGVSLSSVRSEGLAGNALPHAASQSPASAAGATPASQSSISQARRPSEVMEGVAPTPLPIKGDGDAMAYDEDEDEEEEDGEDDAGEWHDKAAKGFGFLSLQANGNPTYVGASSGFSWARLVLAGMSGAAATEGGKYSTRPTTSEPLRQLSLPHHVLPDNSLQNIPDELADMILSQTYRHIQPRYCFIDWLYLHEIWAHRIAITQRATQSGASKALKTAAFFVWMVFAIGSRFCQKLSIPNLASPEAYYDKAMEHLETIVGLHDLKNVQALMLMVMFSFRSSEAPSIWYLVGIIVRLCCSLGLHRKVPPVQARRMSPYILQLRRRIFWAAYTLDRMMAMSLGRPASISDHDIDIELPLDVDCVSSNFDPESKPAGPTSMSSSIHFIKLMRIESLIQKQAYRVDQPVTERPEPLLKMMDDWEESIPAVASEPTCWQLPCCSCDWFKTRVADARMYLLRPRTSNPATAEPALVALIARTAAEACEIQKRLHQSPESTLSLDGLRSIFLCGLTLLHAVQVDRKALPLSALQRAIRANSNTLFIYASAYKGASAYGEVFDELAGAVLDKLMAPEKSPPLPPPNLQPAAATPLFQSLWEDIPSMMTNDAQDSFNALLESLGVSADSLAAPSTGAYSAATNGNGLDLSELGGFAPSSGLDFEPFALGSSAGGLW
ncbi:hypothetical protein JCM8547_001015 [Rhodosporidiobolus lusitaniae]